MNEFYSLSSSTSNSWIYAPSIIAPKNIYTKCETCGSVDIRKDVYSVDLEIEGKGKFPDILLCGAYPFLIVSEKVIRTWEKESLTSYKAHDVRLFRRDQEIKDVKYYNIEVTSESELDFEKMGVKIVKICPECGRVIYDKETWEFGKAYIKDGTWNGTELFYVRYFNRAILCTKNLLEISHKNKLKNFTFHKFEDSFNFGSEPINLKEMFKGSCQHF